ncbi:MAG TPA: hypothetical protein DCE42_03050 [Myxococcales bacterium]|nr:hypothetical protein [Deltaproteobacteria bacterium]MBU47396.1 hypothetical protein [Deltaproteobacteria bacterium]HAA53701.1 hypothetical protein [Myxococcales bacterium]
MRPAFHCLLRYQKGHLPKHSFSKPHTKKQSTQKILSNHANEKTHTTHVLSCGVKKVEFSDVLSGDLQKSDTLLPCTT